MICILVPERVVEFETIGGREKDKLVVALGNGCL